MHLSFLAPLWFEALVAAVLLARVGLDRALAERGRDLPARRREPAEYAVLVAAGLVMVVLLRSGNVAPAAVWVVVVVLADAAWEYRRSAAVRT